VVRGKDLAATFLIPFTTKLVSFFCNLIEGTFFEKIVHNNIDLSAVASFTEYLSFDEYTNSHVHYLIVDVELHFQHSVVA
jgi:hypothetical protein